MSGLALSSWTPPLVMGRLGVYLRRYIGRSEVGEDPPLCSIVCYAIASRNVRLSGPSTPGHSPVRFLVVGDMFDVLPGQISLVALWAFSTP